MSTTGQVVTEGASAGGSIATAATVGSAGGPIGIAVAATAAAIVIGLKALFSRKGPQQRIEATRIVDEAEPYLAANRDNFLRGYRTQADKDKALEIFDYTWGEVVKLLSDPALGNPGKVGISDRDRGGQWDWFAMYRDPIANTNPVSQSDAWSSYAESLTGMDSSKLLLLGGLALVMFGVFKE